MFARTAFCWASPTVMALALAVVTPASAQPAGQPATAGPVEKVIVTGSHIKRARESTSLPVDVVTSQDLEKEGAPTIVEVAKDLEGKAALALDLDPVVRAQAQRERQQANSCPP